MLYDPDGGTRCERRMAGTCGQKVVSADCRCLPKSKPPTFNQEYMHFKSLCGTWAAERIATSGEYYASGARCAAPAPFNKDLEIGGKCVYPKDYNYGVDLEAFKWPASTHAELHRQEYIEDIDCEYHRQCWDKSWASQEARKGNWSGALITLPIDRRFTKQASSVQGHFNTKETLAYQPKPTLTYAAHFRAPNGHRTYPHTQMCHRNFADMLGDMYADQERERMDKNRMRNKRRFAKGVIKENIQYGLPGWAEQTPMNDAFMKVNGVRGTEDDWAGDGEHTWYGEIDPKARQGGYDIMYIHQNHRGRRKCEFKQTTLSAVELRLLQEMQPSYYYSNLPDDWRKTSAYFTDCETWSEDD